MMNLTTENNAAAFVKNTKILLQSIMLITVMGLTACGGGGRDGGINSTGGSAAPGGGSGNNPTGGGTGTSTPPANLEAQKVCFQNSLYPLLTVKNATAITGVNSCSDCHGDTPRLGAPKFASSDMDEAFSNLYNVRLDFINPSQSALVRKVNGNHYPTQIAADTAAAVVLLTAQVQKWADDCNNQGVQPAGGGIFSGVTTFSQAQSAAGGIVARYNDRTIALYTFDDQGGSDGKTVTDSSVLGAPLNLKLEGTYSWEADGGLTFGGGKAIASLADSKKMYDNIGGPAGTRQFSLEAWVTPDAAQAAGGTPYRLMTYAVSSSRSNFTMGQIGQQADANAYVRFRNRSSYTGANGNNNALNTAAGSLPNTLTHVVMTFDETNGRKIYLDGNLIVSDNKAQTIRGNATATNNWDDTYRFVLGNEFSNADRNWKGTMKLMAVHDVALTPEQVKQNFNASIGGQSVTLRFDISTHTGVQNSFITMVASEFGGNAYLFANPKFEVTGGTSSIPVAQNGDLLYTTNCQGCHGAASTLPDRTLAALKASIANVPTMQTTTLQALSDADLTLIETRLSSTYVAPVDGLALFQSNCAGCHGAAPGMSINGTLAGKTVAEIDAAIADTTKSMNTAGLQTLTVVEKTAIVAAISAPVQATGYNIQMDNIRVGVNGTTPPVGQSLKNLSVLITNNNQAVSTLGVVIPQSGGIATDSFFLEFERINLNLNVIVEANPPAPAADTSTVVVPVNGIRNFDQVNDTMSVLTDVSKADTYSSYITLKSQLPSSNSIMTFVASNQVVVMKHALDYCARMIDNNNNYFGTASPTAMQVQDLGVDKILGSNLVSQPNRAGVRADIYTLLTTAGIGCSGDGTNVTSCSNMVKAQKTACIAVLSSAPMMLY
jgi:mono/diheme cytochrome c family protein